MSKVASEVVGGVLNELHLAIKKHDIEKAKSLFEQAKATFDEMEENQDVLIYFSLLEERYRMMLFDARGKRLPDRSYFDDSQSKCIEQTDDMIDYYFYFFEAMHEAYNKNFERAISLYKVAEKKIVKIPDKIEAAEFYFKVSWLYMSLRQSVVSLNYAKDAMNIYKVHEEYKKKLAVSLVVMATNYMHMNRFQEAEEYFTQSIEISKEIEDSFLEAMLHHNISILYSNSGRSIDCIQAVQQALSHDQWCESSYYINSLYMLMREFFKIGEKDKALSYYKKGQEELDKNGNKIYEKKINMIYNVYCRDTSESFPACKNDIHSLNKLNDLDGVHDLSLLISSHYEYKGDYKEALEFAKMAMIAENKMRSLGSEM
ncbi:Rap family tetratricopeptide repeat protein [Bacillus atrophaeus]|uniref:Rap family tetratricopeptide repeat protein n=1 Tax=Bacillus atrophaeus TaxID=1452 RepID=UPI002E21F7E7|nr:tetratricopeptide repeat protein [Bacillus atrophaeus]MED1031198.1 tetratricopeptide repeat protein [Bacillus atrophaeus]MED1120501.1 tetratricopeptide repeat protein [Bacillus atrophaeus]MED1133101.1 tetratricopeptide repeat protein [Bacillus atrophaeus]